MKPTYFSHDPPRFRFPDYSARSWSVVENTRPHQLEPDQIRLMRSKVNRSLGLSRSDAVETDYREVLDDTSYKSRSVDPWTLLLSRKDKGPSSPNRSLLRNRSLIRTNPWMPSTANESPPRSPRSPAASKVHLCRCWSAVERGTAPSSGSCSPPIPITQLRSTNVEKEAIFSRFLYRRDDSLLTTSVESDSLYQSLTSDTDTATSLLSVSDVTLPEVFKDERSRDDVGCDGKEVDRSVLTPLVRCDGDHGHIRGFPPDKNFESDDFKTERNRAKETRKCGRNGSFGHGFNLQPLKRPNLGGGKRFSEIADDFETKTSKWLNAGEVGHTTQRPQINTQTTDIISKAREDHFIEQLNPRPSTNIQQESLVNRDEFEEPTSSVYESPFSTSLQFRKKMTAVRSSLQDKVAMLRREKRMVDEKIREAKEEERIRLLQLDKFRRQLSSTRKEILLRTIEDLKRSLNEQSMKLQKVYDIVLLEERQTMCCH